MFRAKTFVSALVLLLALATTPLRAAEKKDVLSLVPPESQVVIVVKDLAALNSDISKLATRLNVENPGTQSPLETLKFFSGVVNGLDDNGSIAITMPYVPMMMAPGVAPPILAFIPVTDYKAFAGNFGVAEPGDGVSAIHFQGTPAWIKPCGNYALFSLDEATLNAYVAPTQGNFATRAGLIPGSIIQSSDIFAYINITSIAPQLAPMVAMQMAQQKAQMMGMMGAQAAQAGMGIDIASSVIQAVLRDGESICIGLNASEVGFGARFALQFKEGSPLAAQFAKSPASELSFDRLPNQPYFFVFSADLSTLPLQEWTKTLATLMPADAPFTIDPSGLSTLNQSYSRFQAGLYPPNIAAGGGFINSVTVIPTDNPEALLASIKEGMLAANSMQLPQGMTVQAEYTENAIVIEGLKRVDSFRSKTTLPPEQMQAVPAFAASFLEQKGFYIPVKGAVVQVIGTDPSKLKEIASAADGSSDLADAHISAIRANLLPNRVVEGYLGFGSVAKFANSFLSLFFPAYIIESQENLPPIAVGVSVGGGGVAGSLHVPVEIVEVAKSWIEKVQRQQQQQQLPPQPEPETTPEVQ